MFASMSKGPRRQATPDRTKMMFIVLSAVLAVALVGVVVWTFPKPGGGVAPTSSPTATTSPTSTPTPPEAPAAQTCGVGELSVRLGGPDVGAGTTTVPIIFQNTGARTCQLEGYPGVSFVGGGNGTQIGAPANRDASVAIVFTELSPGSSVQAGLRISQASNYESCGSEPADGLRIYPPHSYDAIFVPTTAYEPCKDVSVDLMMVQPVQPQ